MIGLLLIATGLPFVSIILTFFGIIVWSSCVCIGLASGFGTEVSTYENFLLFNQDLDKSGGQKLVGPKF